MLEGIPWQHFLFCILGPPKKFPQTCWARNMLDHFRSQADPKSARNRPRFFRVQIRLRSTPAGKTEHHISRPHCPPYCRRYVRFRVGLIFGPISICGLILGLIFTGPISGSIFGLIFIGLPGMNWIMLFQMSMICLRAKETKG